MKITLPLFVTLVSLTHVSLSLPLSGDVASARVAVKRAISETEETPGAGATNVFDGPLKGGNGLLGGLDTLGGGEDPVAALIGFFPVGGNILGTRQEASSETKQTPGDGATNVFDGSLGGDAGSTLLGSGGGEGLLGGSIGGGFDALGGGIENPAAGALSAVAGLLPGVGNILPARRDADWESNETPGDGATNIFDGFLGGDAGSTWLGADGGNGPLGGNINGGFDALNGGEGDVVGDTLGTVTGILPARGA